MPDSTKKETGKEEKFVEYVFRLAQKDTGFAAKMRRADNRVTEDYAWEFLAPWVDLSIDSRRLPYALVGAAVCREKTAADGSRGIGSLLAASCTENTDNGASRLRRLLACDSVVDACHVLRQMLKFLQSRCPGEISYARLLKELMQFAYGNGDRTKQKWAMDFYNNIAADDNKDANNE